jgi:DNA-binding NtrC family response regulator
MIETWQRLHWSGNARELRSAVERYLLLGDDAWQAAAQSSDVMAAFNPELSFRAAKEVAVTQFEQGYLAMLIERHGGNLSQAARAAHMDRNHLRQLLRRHQIEPKRG